MSLQRILRSADFTASAAAAASAASATSAASAYRQTATEASRGLGASSKLRDVSVVTRGLFFENITICAFQTRTSQEVWANNK
jgi:hypothetical protein